MCLRGLIMRIPRALVVLVASSELVLGACSEAEEVEVASSPAASAAVSESGEEASSLAVDEPRTASLVPVDPGLLGMHVVGAQEGEWLAESVPVESLRLFYTGTSWL